MTRSTPLLDDLADALRDLLARVGDGTLVRDTTKDSEPTWAIRRLVLAENLDKAKELLDEYDNRTN